VTGFRSLTDIGTFPYGDSEGVWHNRGMDRPQGENWWQASDGKWYPPESWPGPQPTSRVPEPYSRRPRFGLWIGIMLLILLLPACLAAVSMSQMPL
jgi:hypothetical protein